MSVPVLSVRNLCVAFAGRSGLERVVDGISFDLSAGEIVGLVGESGCGKSVTCMALMVWLMFIVKCSGRLMYL